MPPRSKSTRSKGSKVPKKEEVEFIDSGDDSEFGLSKPKKLHKSPKKPTKSSETAQAPWQRPRGRGKLKMLPEMPLDILFEIFSLITPLDVLHLSRTTKALRAILISRTSVTVWKAAFELEPEVPAAPKDLNEPQWANLVFSKHCHHCLSPGEHYILVPFRTRTCTTCMKEHYGTLQEVTTRMKGKLICDKAELLHRAGFFMKSGSSRVPKLLYSYADAKSVNLQLAQRKADKVALEAYIAERLKFVENDRILSNNWEESISLRQDRLEREAQEYQFKLKRRALLRLEELGFEEEVKRLNELDHRIISEHPSIAKYTKDPTDRVWKRVLPPLIEMMEETREKLQRKQRKNLLKQRLRIIVDLLNTYAETRPSTDPLPSAADICIMPQVKAIVENPSLEAYTDLESFAEIQTQLPSLCHEWITSKNKELLALMPRVAGVPNGPGSDESFRLELATSFFKCSECLEPISYPRILAHSCLTTLRIGNRNREDDVALIFSSLDSEPWNFDGGRVKYFKSAEASSRGVIRACGFTADVATSANLNDMGRWLECLHCSHRVKGRAVFKWQRAILHDMNHVVADNKSAVWMALTDDEAKIAQKKEDDTYATHHSDHDDFVCLRCRKLMTFAALKSHARFEHGVQDLQGKDYCLHFDAVIQPPFSIVIPHQPGELGSATSTVVAGPSVENDVIDLVTPLQSDVEGADDDDDFYV